MGKQKYMTFEEFLENVKMLSHSQGQWGRLLKDIEEDSDYKETWKQAIENGQFVDFVIQAGW